MYTIITLASILLLELVHASPPPRALNGRYTVYRSGDEAHANITARTTGSIPRKFVDSACTEPQKYQILDAWKDAADLANAQTGSVAGFDYGTPHTNWLGKDWNFVSWLPWGDKWGNQIKDNFKRVRALYSDDNAPSGEWIYFYCKDYGGDACQSPGTFAYTWDSTGTFWSNHYVILCDAFFKADTMQTKLTKYANNAPQQNVIDNFRDTKGSIIFHESYHFKDTVSVPRTNDLAYGPDDTWNLAKNKGTGSSFMNAESYEYDAIAILVQQFYKLAKSPIPWSQRNTLDAKVAAAVAAQPPAPKTGHPTMGDGPPKGFTGPVPNTETPDTKVWVEFGQPIPSAYPTQPAGSAPSAVPTKPPGPAPALPSCAGVNSPNWMGRDALNSVIPSFCDTAEKQGVQDPGSGSLQRNFLTGGVDAVSLSIDWPSGGAFKPNKDDCIKIMSSIMDGCDGNDLVNNPMNWKHGGFVQAGIAKFNINPLTTRYKSGICSFHLHEKDSWWGIDGPGTERKHTFNLRVDVKDGAGKIIGGTKGQEVEAGKDGQNPYVFQGLYQPLSFTPEARGDYIQFAIGTNRWTTNDVSGASKCSVGAWDSGWTPSGRDMDCSFPC